MTGAAGEPGASCRGRSSEAGPEQSSQSHEERVEEKAGALGTLEVVWGTVAGRWSLVAEQESEKA